jgi:hypothetical protein
MLILLLLLIVLILMQGRCMVALNVPLALKSFWTHPMVLLGVEALVDSHYSPFGDSANLDAR